MPEHQGHMHDHRRGRVAHGLSVLSPSSSSGRVLVPGSSSSKEHRGGGGRSRSHGSSSLTFNTEKQEPKKGTKRKTKLIIALGIALPVLACIIGIAAWAITTDVLRITPRNEVNSFTNFRRPGRSKVLDSLQSRSDGGIDVFLLHSSSDSQLSSTAAPKARNKASTLAIVPSQTASTTNISSGKINKNSTSTTDILSKLISSGSVKKTPTEYIVFAPILDSSDGSKKAKLSKKDKQLQGKVVIEDEVDLLAEESVSAEKYSSEKKSLTNEKNFGTRKFMQVQNAYKELPFLKTVNKPTARSFNIDKLTYLSSASNEFVPSSEIDKYIDSSSNIGISTLSSHDQNRRKYRPSSFGKSIHIGGGVADSVLPSKNTVYEQHFSQPSFNGHQNPNSQLHTPQNFNANDFQSVQLQPIHETLQKPVMLPSQSQTSGIAYGNSFDNSHTNFYSQSSQNGFANAQQQIPMNQNSFPQQVPHHNIPQGQHQTSQLQFQNSQQMPSSNPYHTSHSFADNQMNFHNKQPQYQPAYDLPTNDGPQYFAPPPQTFHTTTTYKNPPGQIHKYSAESPPVMSTYENIAQASINHEQTVNGHYHHHHHHHHETNRDDGFSDINLSNSPPNNDADRLGTIGVGLGSPRGITLQIGGGGGGGGLTGLLPIGTLGIARGILSSLLPRPSLGLNGKVFFGVEVGRNGGLMIG